MHRVKLYLISLFLLVGLCSNAWAPMGHSPGLTAPPWVRIQGLGDSLGTNSTTRSETFTAAVKSGDIVIGFLWLEPGTIQLPISTIGDDKGNQYVWQSYASKGTGYSVVVFWSNALLTNGPVTVTVTCTTTQAIIGVVMDEMQPPPGTTAVSYDGSQSNAIVAASGFANVGTFVTTNTNDLVWSGFVSNFQQAFTPYGWSPGSFTPTGVGNSMGSEFMNQPTPSATTSASWEFRGGGFSQDLGIVAIAIAPTTQASWSPLQHAVENTGSGTLASISFAKPVSAGSVVCGTAFFQPTPQSTIGTIVDNAGNTYQTAVYNSAGMIGFWSNGVINNAPQTITVNATVSTTTLWVAATEFATPPGKQLVALDGTPSVQNGAGTTASTGSIITAANGDLLCAGVAGLGNTQASGGFSAGAGVGQNMSTEYMFQSTAGSVAATMATFNGSWFAEGFGISAATGGGGGGNVVFTPLQRYFITTAANGGSDANDGLAPTVGGGHGPWATPSHPVHCGDVILVQPGTYGLQFNGGGSGGIGGPWGLVTNCPSGTGGIDGTGGIQFAVLLCAGSSLTSCQVNSGTATGIWPTSNNAAGGHWAIEGFSVSQTQGTNTSGGCFLGENDTLNFGTSAPLNYLAFINDVASGCNLAGFTVGSATYPSGSWDHIATVGVIAFNGADSASGGGICGSNMSLIPVNSGSDTGTHTFTAGYFGYKGVNNINGGVCPSPGGTLLNTDGEGIIWDSVGVASYNQQIVIEQSVMWANGSSCIEFFPAGSSAATDAAQYFVFNNTCVNNMADSNHVAGAELYANGISPTAPGLYSITNNIILGQNICPGGIATCTGFQDGICNPGNTGDCAAAVTAGQPGEDIRNYTPRITITGNYIFDSHSPTTGSTGGNNTWVSDGVNGTLPWQYGTNTYATPGLSDVPHLMNLGAPSCAPYTNVYSCMVGMGVIGFIGNTTGVGYKSPGPCAPDAFYPTWLKGVVYLTASGYVANATITENTGLVTKPCGL